MSFVGVPPPPPPASYSFPSQHGPCITSLQGTTLPHNTEPSAQPPSTAPSPPPSCSSPSTQHRPASQSQASLCPPLVLWGPPSALAKDAAPSSPEIAGNTARAACPSLPQGKATPLLWAGPGLPCQPDTGCKTRSLHPSPPCARTPPGAHSQLRGRARIKPLHPPTSGKRCRGSPVPGSLHGNRSELHARLPPEPLLT